MFANDEIIDTEYSYYTPYDLCSIGETGHYVDKDGKTIIDPYYGSYDYFIEMERKGLPYGINDIDSIESIIYEREPRLLQFKENINVSYCNNTYDVIYSSKYNSKRAPHRFSIKFLKFDPMSTEIKYIDYTIDPRLLTTKFCTVLRELSSAKVGLLNVDKLFTINDHILINNIIGIMRSMCIGYVKCKFSKDTFNAAQDYMSTCTYLHTIKCDSIKMNIHSDAILLFNPLIIFTSITPFIFHGMKICYVYNEKVLNNIKEEIIHEWPISLGGQLPDNGDDYVIVLYKSHNRSKYIFTNIATGEEMDYNSLVDMMRFMRYSTKSARMSNCIT